ncbi:MAG: exo-alpha-sialidase, partial [Pirellulales bacterium]
KPKPGEITMSHLLPKVHLLLLVVMASTAHPFVLRGQAAGQDMRNIATGFVIPDEGYCDQPYVVITNDGKWLCLLTTAGGHEGAANSHVVSTISADQGRTWSKLVELEPTDGPPSVYSLPVVARSGRVYAFYDYNGDNFRCPGRSDCVGWFVYKYSDDNGRTWSSERYRLPMRMTAVDRMNTFAGKVQIFWGIGKPITFGDTMMFAFSKCGKYLIDRSEGWFYRSDNLLTESDVNKIHWQLLPDGDVGLKNPAYGEVQAEQNIVALNDGSIYCMYRTAGDHPCHAYSRDRGHTWTMPEYATYSPGGRPFKNSRACPKVWKTVDGRYLFWFHHHGAHKNAYRGRNPAWLSGGIERDGFIHWSQPEIVLYDTDSKNCLFDAKSGVPGPGGGMSYPDLIQQKGRTWITETQKTVARVHAIDPELLEGLWSQGKVKTVAKKGLVLDLGPERLGGGEVEMPQLPSLAPCGGFAVDFWIEFDDLSAGQVILDSRNAVGKGFVVETSEHGTIRIEIGDGQHAGFWACDRDLLQPSTSHHIVAIVDGGPDVISFVVDGILCDGGEAAKYGWGRFSPEIGDVGGPGMLRIAPKVKGQLKRLRIYNRYLRTSEAISHYHAGP